MSIELSRAAHYYGGGIPEPVEVWRGRLDDTTEVYFTQPYDWNRQSEVPVAAMTVTTQTDAEGTSFRYEFEPHANNELTWPYRAMLGHAALYPMDERGNIRPKPGADQVEIHDNTSAILRQIQIYRARYLPESPKSVA